jgi:hypothetical protein
MRQWRLRPGGPSVVAVVLAVVCAAVVVTALPAEAARLTPAASLGPRWGGTIDLHETYVEKTPVAASAEGGIGSSETTTEASVHWTFDQPPPKSRAPDDLVKDVNAVGTAKVTASVHGTAGDLPPSDICFAPQSWDASGSSTFTDLVEIQDVPDADPSRKGWYLALGIDDEFPYNKPPYKPRGVDLPGTSVPFPGCQTQTFSTSYPVPGSIFVGAKGITATATSLEGTYTKTLTCSGIIQDRYGQETSCEAASDWLETLELTVTVDLHRIVSSAPPGAPSLPVITGVARPGNRLTVSLPGWTAAERGAARFSWSRCWGPRRCARTAPSTTSSYLVKPSDTGSQITVTASSVVNGHAYTLRSKATAPVGSSGSGGRPPGR